MAAKDGSPQNELIVNELVNTNALSDIVRVAVTSVKGEGSEDETRT